MIKNDKIKYSQMALLLCVIIPAEKVLGLPVSSFKCGGRDFWVALAINFILDFVCLIPILIGLKNNKNNVPVREIMNNAIGKIPTKIIFALLGLTFVAKFLVVFSDTLSLFFNTFVFKSNWVAFAAVALIAGGFLLIRGFKTIARLSEIYFIPVVVCLIAIIALSIKDCDINNLRPFADEGFAKIGKTCLFSSFYFSDFLLIWLLSGDITEINKRREQIPLGFAAGGILAVAVSVVYIALFGELAHYGDVAIARVSQFNLNSLNVGRLDWLLIAVWINAIFFLLFTYAHCFIKCCENVLLSDTGEDLKNKKTCAIASYAVFGIAVVLLPLFFDIRFVISGIMQRGWGKYPFIAISAALAFSFPFFVNKVNKKQSATTRVRGKRVKILEV